MNKTHLWLLLVILSFIAQTTIGQSRNYDIVRITYKFSTESMFSRSDKIVLDIDGDGEIKMYNNMLYDSASEQHIEELTSGGSRTIAVEDFLKMTVGDSLASYFVGKIGRTDFEQLTNLIKQTPGDTTQIDINCCCDIPYSVIRVYFKNGNRKTFMNCDSDKSLPLLMNCMNKIANKRGYPKPSARLNLAGIH